MGYIGLVIVMLLGMAMIFIPETLWKIEHIFTVKNGEPTDLYLALMRVGGIFFIGTALLMLAVSLIRK